MKPRYGVGTTIDRGAPSSSPSEEENAEAGCVLVERQDDFRLVLGAGSGCFRDICEMAEVLARSVPPKDVVCSGVVAARPRQHEQSAIERGKIAYALTVAHG